MNELFFGIYKKDNFIYTLNFLPGEQVYGERLVKENGKEYRSFDPYRSKLCASIKKGLKTWPFKENSKILYLGASTGTTVSHISDICTKGEIFAVEISPHVIDKLVNLAEKRENIIPILGDARKPQDYLDVGKVDIIYEDVSQPNQSEILIRNAIEFLKKNGIAMIAVKSQSIDVIKDPEEVYKKVIGELKEYFEVIEKVNIDSYDKGHVFLVLKKKN
ncbi:MAG: fibrillarin-like rRNA/tRNA 2'-O-methyltransferase [Candidatus ainarchaeum sp.]|nr:fibrillarin-like rRNA/tRNA 2'-O-methyltransferase [Candidatus ainarchaeum sp.]